MTRIEYDLLREQEPQLKLPRVVQWENPTTTPKSDLAWLHAATRDEVIAARTAEAMMRGRLPDHLMITKRIAKGHDISMFVNTL